MYVSMIDSTDFINSRNCFFQYHNTGFWDASVTFIGNKAKNEKGGHAIYATSIRPCQVVKQVSTNKSVYDIVNDTEKLFDIQRFKFDSNTTLQPQIATDGAELHSTKSSPLLIFPDKNSSMVLR